MADDVIEIPLFPLDLVLFPGMVQPLHVFEPRYREMMKRCLDSAGMFGMALALPESAPYHEVPARAGSMARILDYHRLPDGRYNLLAVGARRFEIVETLRDRPYLRGRVRILPEEVGAGPIETLTVKARRLLDEYLTIVLADSDEGPRDISVPADPIELSYFIAVLLPCDDGVKQKLLEAVTAVERLTLALGCLRHEVVVARETEERERAAHPANGGGDDHRPARYLHRA